MLTLSGYFLELFYDNPIRSSYKHDIRHVCEEALLYHACHAFDFLYKRDWVYNRINIKVDSVVYAIG